MRKQVRWLPPPATAFLALDQEVPRAEGVGPGVAMGVLGPWTSRPSRPVSLTPGTFAMLTSVATSPRPRPPPESSTSSPEEERASVPEAVINFRLLLRLDRRRTHQAKAARHRPRTLPNQRPLLPTHPSSPPANRRLHPCQTQPQSLPLGLQGPCQPLRRPHPQVGTEEVLAGVATNSICVWLIFVIVPGGQILMTPSLGRILIFFIPTATPLSRTLEGFFWLTQRP